MSEEQVGAKRRRRSRAEISQLVREYLASGLSAQQFCAHYGLNLSTLRRRLALMGQPEQAACRRKWVAVEISSAEPASGPVPSGLVLALGSYRIELARGFDRETLGQLLTLLEAR